jgi:hypothetical protein
MNLGGTASGRGTLWARTCQSLVGTLLVVALSAVAAELVARYVFDLSPLVYTRTLQPVFVMGDQVPPAMLAAMRDAPGGPGSLGYRPSGLAFQVDPAAPPPTSATTLSDFLFEHQLSRYSARDVDRILCGDPDASVLFVLGGSGAQGFSASSRLRAWHVLLETALRRKLGKPNLYVFNAAMGGYVSFQEKLAFHLVVAARAPAAVLFYNSYNDLVLEPISGTRPGDPPWLATWYGAVYGDRPLFWLAEHSAIANTVLQNMLAGSMIDLVARLERDDALFEQRVGAAVDLYLESMSEVLAVCEAERRPCWVALQPNRALTSARTGGATPDVLSTRRMVQIYDMLQRRLAGHRYRERFVDLAGVFDGSERERYFTDPVHVSDSGQPLIADALVAPIASSLAAPLPRGRAVDRCAALTQPQLLAVVPLDRITADGDGHVSRSEGIVALRADPRQWAFAAHATIELDPAWFSRQIEVRIRLAVSKGDVSVVVLDESTGKEVSHDRPFTADDGNAMAELAIRGHPHRLSVIFKKELADGVASEVIVREIAVLAR